LGLGEWLTINGDALFDTRPWQVAEGKTDGGIDVRFTQKGDSLYATVLDTPATTQFVLANLQAAPNTTIRVLGQPAPVAWRQREEGIVVELPTLLSSAPAHALQITPQPQRLS
jgi:alpha-L-fucosidase